MRRSSSARQSGVIGEGLNISLLALFQQYLHLLLGLLQGLLAMTGQRNTAFEITQRLFQAELAMLHFLDERLALFERVYEGKGGLFLGQETAPVEARHVSAPPLHGQCGAGWKRRGRAANKFCRSTDTTWSCPYRRTHRAQQLSTIMVQIDYRIRIIRTRHAEAHPRRSLHARAVCRRTRSLPRPRACPPEAPLRAARSARRPPYPGSPHRPLSDTGDAARRAPRRGRTRRHHTRNVQSAHPRRPQLEGKLHVGGRRYRPAPRRLAAPGRHRTPGVGEDRYVAARVRRRRRAAERWRPSPIFRDAIAALRAHARSPDRGQGRRVNRRRQRSSGLSPRARSLARKYPSGARECSRLRDLPTRG